MAGDTNKSVGMILVDMAKISLEQLEELETLCHDKKLIFEEELIRKGWASPEDVNEALAVHFEMEICKDPKSFKLPDEIYQKVPYSFAKKHLLLPLEQRNNSMVVATADPLNLDALDELRFLLGCDIYPLFSPKNNLLEAINQCYEKDKGAASSMLAGMKTTEQSKEQTSISDSYDLLDEKKENDAPLVKLLNLIITEAIQQGASDIHFEPSENDLKVRYRIDGVLHNRHSPPQEYQAQLLTRIKVMAKLDIAERRLPQDGRIKLSLGKREIDFRVSTVPVVNGERIVLRILDKGNIVLGLESLGMPQNISTPFQKLIRLPEGIILVTGPTGSGKTTTLYSVIKELCDNATNIMTIEDPVEYKMSGIAQIGVRPKIDLDFARGLRHILRQDPDVIMVGEIRDCETAEIAIQAALTGHLVLSTLHTNDAPSAMTRLVDMGIEPYLLSSSIVGVLAQRLVRTICSDCSTHYTPTKEELLELGIKQELDNDQQFFRGEGCHSCFNSGYKGRHGIYELMTISNKIKRHLTKNADSSELRAIALEEGMQSLRYSGSQLVLKGITTVEEVLRVTRNSDTE